MAFPLFALVFAVSTILGTQQYQLSGQLTTYSQPAEGKIVSVAQGIDALLYSGPGFSEGDFQGSALVRTIGLRTIDVAGYRTTAASGVFHITMQNGVFTVAALTTPVVLQLPDAYVVVPVGAQWQSKSYKEGSAADIKQWLATHATTTLPQRFIERQLQNMASLPEMDIESFLPGMSDMSLVARAPWLDMFLLPKAREDIASERVQASQNSVREAIETGNFAAVEAAIQSGIDPVILSVLLENMSHDSALTLTLLENIITNDVVWLTYSTHPRWRDAAWAIPFDGASTEAMAVRILTLPLSDDLPQAVTGLSLQRWLDSVLVYASSVADPIPFLEELVELVGKHALQADATGYPQRAQSWVQNLHTLLTKLPINMPTETVERVQHLQSYGAVDTSAPIALPKTEEPTDVSTPVEVVPEVIAEQYTPDVVEQRTLSILEDMGAIFTVETTVSATAPNTSTVRGVLFSAPSGDYLFDFQYNVVTGQITDIIRNNQAYPYALDVGAFRAWVQK